jgi:hypothetical protein
MTRVSQHQLSFEELNAHSGEALPDRAAMSLVNANLAIPINLALAANVLSDSSAAVAGATQQTPIVQGI